MDWFKNMNHAMDYIEGHLQGKTDYEKIAKIACCSVYHFQRTFTFMTDITLSEYIRRRKMTLVAFELQNSNAKIIDLALNYGYESPEAFTRAFQALHGISPTLARKCGANIKAFPRISFQLTVKGVTEMNYKIVEHEAFQVYGLERIFDMKDGENIRAIPAFWAEIGESGESTKLMKSANYPMEFLNGVCGYRKIEGTKFPYMICSLKTPLSNTSGYTVIDVPKATWAVLVNEPHDMEDVSTETQKLISRVYTDWLPTANYTIVEGFEFEMYYSDSNGKCYEEMWCRVSVK